MAKKKETGSLPQTAEMDSTPGSNITYASEVIAIIAGLAASEVEGIAGMINAAGTSVGKNKNITRGIRVEMGTEEVALDLYVIVEYGTPIQRAAMDAQESVRKAIESMTGLHVVRVDVHVQNVSFEKENKALQAGARSALEAGSAETAVTAAASGRKAEGTESGQEKAGLKQDAPADKTDAPKE